uniref:Calcineurin-like phosphoesterase domain-containing protein n=1 Tax=viral metagenome TaxID=1070528 RepID=A0A6C0K1D3_9ZZZZ
MPIPDYNFTELFCWSDEEGGNPFRDWDKNAISDLLHSKFEFSADGLLIGLKGDVAIGFLGDLLDNEAYSIRVLQAMIRLKDTYPDRVLLIGGNRDFNKIRMGIELFIQAEDGLPWTGIADMHGLLARLAEPFRFRKTHPPEYLLDVLKAWTDSMPAITAAYTGGDIEARVNIMYGKTLGAPLDMMKHELNAILGEIPEALYAKLICTMQMVMSFHWDDLPEFLEPFNGLYLTYLRQCHVIASFRINGQTGIMSHAGMPDGTIKGNRLTSPFGFQVTEDMPDAMLSIVLNEIEDEKNRLIETVQGLRDRNYNSATADEEINDLINKYVHMTAGVDAQFPADSGVIAETSPIVGLQKVATSDRRDIEVQLGGGTFGWIGRQKGQKIKRVSSGPTTIAYNIYGHAPQGFLPTAYRYTPEGTLHVNLDVSKLEEKANALSFVFLHIDGATTEFIGRIKFPKAGKNTAGSVTTYTGDARALPNTVHYYIEPIVEKDLSKERPIPGTPNIIVKYVKYDREVTTKAAGGRRKTIRRRSKRFRTSRKVRFARK